MLNPAMRDPHAPRTEQEPADPNWRHPVEEMEPAQEESFSLGEVAEALYYVLSELKRANCPAQLLDCMCLATGLSTYYNENGSKLAAKYGVSRQRIHTVKEGIQHELGVVGDAFAKREGAAEGYRLTNHRNTKCQN